MEQTGMGQQESCTGLSVSQPGQEPGDSKGRDVEEGTDPHTQADDLRTEEEHNTSITKHNRSTTETIPPPRLKAIIEAWERLPEAVRAGISVMVEAYLNSS